MATTGFGPVVPFPAPLLRPYGTFLQTAERVDLGPRFPLGITYVPFDYSDLFLNNVDCIPSGLEDPHGVREPQSMAAFSVYDAIVCSSLTEPSEAFVRAAIEDRRILLSQAVALEMRFGSFTGNPSLADAVSYGPATNTMAEAVAVLEEKLAIELNNTYGVIHVPPNLLVGGVTNGTINLRNGRYYTPGGHSVISDAGYQTTSATRVWATGPVYYDLIGPIDLTPTGESVFDRTGNLVAAFEETYAVIMFDQDQIWYSEADAVS